MRKPRKLTKPEAASLGGNARAAKLSPKRRREIARGAAMRRWAKAPCGGCDGAQRIGDTICNTCGGTGKHDY